MIRLRLATSDGFQEITPATSSHCEGCQYAIQRRQQDQGKWHFDPCYLAVKEMHDAVGAPMPVIYGYRGAKAKTKGTSYEAWRRTVAKHLVETNEQARKLRDDAAYAALGLGYVREERRACIPAGHPVRVLLERYAQNAYSKHAKLPLEASPTDAPAAELDVIIARWPLLKDRNIADLLSSHWADAWVDYLKR